MTGAEILANLNKPTIYIGEVMEIYNKDSDAKDALDEPNSIRFTIPGVTDGIVKYPTARLIGNRTKRVKEGDTVFIIKQGSLNNIFFYMPMDISDFIGCAYDEDHYLKFNNESIELKNDNSSISVTDKTISISNSLGSVTINESGIKLTKGESSVSVEDDNILLSTKGAVIELDGNELTPSLSIKVKQGNNTVAAIGMDSIVGLNLGISPGKFIVLPPGTVGFSTLAGVLSLTVPVLPGSTPIIEIPAIMGLTYSQNTEPPANSSNKFTLYGVEYEVSGTSPIVIPAFGVNKGSVELKVEPVTHYRCIATYDGSEIINSTTTTTTSINADNGKSLKIEFIYQNT